MGWCVLGYARVRARDLFEKLQKRDSIVPATRSHYPGRSPKCGKIVLRVVIQEQEVSARARRDDAEFAPAMQEAGGVERSNS